MFSKRVSPDLARRTRSVMMLLDAAETLDELAARPGLALEKLSGDRSGSWSIRINRQYRLCFGWTAQASGERGEATDVELVDYH